MQLPDGLAKKILTRRTHGSFIEAGARKRRYHMTLTAEQASAARKTPVAAIDCDIHNATASNKTLLQVLAGALAAPPRAVRGTRALRCQLSPGESERGADRFLAALRVAARGRPRLSAAAAARRVGSGLRRLESAQRGRRPAQSGVRRGALHGDQRVADRRVDSSPSRACARR